MYKIYKHFDINDVPSEIDDELRHYFQACTDISTSYPFYCEDYLNNYWLNEASKFFIAHGAEKNELIYISNF